jgi:hypothetical protein
MLYSKVINNNVEVTGTLQQLFPNVSFPSQEIDLDFITANNLYEVKSYEVFDSGLYKLVDTEPYFENGVVYSYRIVPKTAEDFAIENDSASNFIREQRNQLLKESDWTQVADAPVDKVVWAVYRQALRDITAQEGFPFNVVFPELPLG